MAQPDEKQHGTDAWRRFREEGSLQANMIGAVLGTAVTNYSEELHKELADAYEKYGFTSVDAGTATDRIIAQTPFLEHKTIFLEVIICRVIDSFISHISDVLGLIFLHRPETLHWENEKFPVKEILDFDSIDDLRAHIVERRVNELSYKSINDLAKYLRDKSNLELFQNERETTQLTLYVEVRNLAVHNRMVMNKRFVERTNGSENNIGKRLTPEFVDLSKAISITIEIASRLDAAAIEKFGVPNAAYGIDGALGE
ncbi:MAG: hypothetical protein HQ495_10235 [Alphaproteobacteria bacterium]|nr:hypothetical protein [Alphaproteobacteria bacterium]